MAECLCAIGLPPPPAARLLTEDYVVIVTQHKGDYYQAMQHALYSPVR